MVTGDAYVIRSTGARFGGRVWVEGKVNEGAAVYFLMQPARERPACM